MFDGLAGIDVSRYLMAIGVVGLGLLGLIGVMWVIRNRPSSPFVRGGRARQPRLAVVDATAVDARRRIILVRRDNVEHLIMIGGPTDIVIESRISSDNELPQPLAMAQPEQQEALPKPAAPFELAPPPLMVAEQPSIASAQTQSAPPLKAKLWPTEPKPAVPATQPIAAAKSLDEPFAFQPQAAAATSAKTSSASPMPVIPSSGSAPVAQKPTSSQAFAEPELEIRNPYLEAETAVPASAQTQAAQQSAAKPASAPVAALHKWLRPEQAEKTNATSAPSVPPKEHQPNPKTDSLPSSAVAPSVAQNPSSGSLKTHAEGSGIPETKAATSAVPVDLDSLISSDFLDAARNRVLSPEAQKPGRLETLSAPEPPLSPPRVPPTATPNSEFAKILDEEIRTGLPESRFDKPRVDPSFPSVAQPQSRSLDTAPIAERPAAAQLMRAAPIAASMVQSAEVQKDTTDAGVTSKTIADILEVAKFRVMEPARSAGELRIDEKSIEQEATTHSALKDDARSDSDLTDHIAAEFEKIWDVKAADTAPKVELNSKRPDMPDAPVIRMDEQPVSINDKHDILGRDVRHDPLLDIHLDEPGKQSKDDELSLDDEMARVLGEFSLDRKS